MIGFFYETAQEDKVVAAPLNVVVVITYSMLSLLRFKVPHLQEVDCGQRQDGEAHHQPHRREPAKEP